MAEDTNLNRHLTPEQLNVLHQIGSMSDEDFEKHRRLLAQEQEISSFFTKRKAYALVFGSAQKMVTWFAAFVGGLWLGLDKIKAVFAFLIDIITQTT